MFRKALIGGALVVATITGGAIGSSMIGVASAQTDDSTTTTAPSTTGSEDAPRDKENCPEKDGAAAESSDTTAS